MKIEVKNLRKSFSGKEVLHGISFSVESGKALGLLGRNGAGKTTTIRILMDVFKCNSGEILIDGKPFTPKDYKIGYMPEERGLYPKRKIIDQIIYFANLKSISKKEAIASARKFLKRFDMLEYENKTLDTLSKGNQQKIQLIQTLICNPDIIILDEPFSGLDPVNSQILKNIVAELINNNKIVIFSSHQMSYVEEFCENITIINKGSVSLSGNLKNIKKEFGKNRLILSSNNYNLNELKYICEKHFNDIVKIYKIAKDFLILELCNNLCKNDFLQKIINSDIDIERFAVYEPTLTDIFVLKAGDN